MYTFLVSLKIRVGSAGYSRERKHHSRKFPEGYGIMPGRTNKKESLFFYVIYFFNNF